MVAVEQSDLAQGKCNPQVKISVHSGKKSSVLFFLLTVDSLWGYGWKSPIRTFLNERVMNVEVLDVPRNIL